ncbi:hypothetical protein DEO72_LG7g679 [Vigna unguiculata]|uniref:Uncharacterized protein n=1 Tax=Vigna unguiculata TaxID=3917 RepID=A0A4D6MGJ3_VIGUN|nr:hypothetical protein DEO72_LG7g679 [Vigna unguiculata]
MKSQFTFLFPQIHFLPKTRIKNPVLLTVGLAPRYRHLFAATVGLASTFQVRRRWRKHIGSVFSSATAFYDPHRHFGIVFGLPMFVGHRAHRCVCEISKPFEVVTHLPHSLPRIEEYEPMSLRFSSLKPKKGERNPAAFHSGPAGMIQATSCASKLLNNSPNAPLKASQILATIC